jgi:hypothetical protein
VAVSGTVIIALAVLSLGLIFTAVAIDSIPLALLAITGLAYSLVLAIARTPA